MKKITLMFFMMIFSICAYAQLPQETFDTWPVGAGGWSTYQNEFGTNLEWALNPAGSTALPSHSDPHAAYMSRANVPTGNPQDWLITPQFNVPLNAQLRFWSRLVQGGDQGTRYDVLISTNPDPASGTFVSLIDADGWSELEINPQQLVYTEKILSIPASYVGQQVYIAFKMTSVNGGDRWLVDDVSVVQECLAPTTPTVTAPTINGATFNWTAPPGGAPQYEVEVVLASSNPVESGTLVNATTYTPTNLQPGTQYKYYVRSVCGPNSTSAWVGPVNFTTVALGATCAAPKVIPALPYSTTDNTVLYGDDIEGSPGATGCGTTGNFLNGNEVVYSYTATFTGVVSVSMTGNGPNSGMFVYNSCANIGVSCIAGGTGNATTPVNISSLNVTSGTTYYIVIATSGTTLTTPYTLTIQQVNCAPPVGQPTTGITENNALLSWTNPSSAAAWEVAIQPAGSPIPSGSGTVVFSNQNVPASDIMPLTAGTQYQYYVRADCGNGTFSAWAGPYLFNTTLCAPANQCTWQFVMTDLAFGWEGNTMSIKQNGITVATIGSTFTSGTGPVTINVPLCHNAPMELYWNSGGSFANEVGISIVNSFGQTIYTKAPGTGNQNSSLFNTVVDCLVPECLPPTGLTASNQAMTTATLGWNGPASGNYEFVYMPINDPAPTASTVGIPSSTNTVDITGLTAATQYKFYVRLLCSSGEISAWAGPFNFNTTICPPASQCVYNFVMTDSFGGWEGNTMSIKQNGITVATIGSTFTSGTGPVTVGVPLCNGIPFELFWNTGGSFAGEVGVKIVNPFNQTLYTHAPGTDLRGTTLYTGMVDCINPACLPPTGVTSSAITTTSATIAWAGPATGNWEYYIVPADQPAPTDATPGTPVTTNPFTISTLTAATNYKVYIRAVCTTGNSPWSAVHNFSTKVCVPADQCNYSFVMTDVGFGWEGNTMSIIQSGVVVATIGSTFTSGTGPVTVQVPLCHNVPFSLFWNTGGSFATEVGIKIVDPFGEDLYTHAPGTDLRGTTLYSDVAYCVPPTCPKPKNLTATAITQTSANLGWLEQSDAAQWEVVVLPVGSPAPTGPGTQVTTNPAPWTGLQPGTTYVFYVRADCGAVDGMSTWAGPFQFTTQISNDECANAITVPVNPGIDCTAVGHGTVIGATASPQPNTCGGNDNDDVWFQFTATASTHSITLQNILGSTTDLFHVLYSGDQCGSLTQLYCSDDNNSTANGLVPGTVYKVRVYSWSGTAQTSTFDICVRTPPPPIAVTQTMTVEELVTDVLIGSECAVVNNITSSTGSNFGQANGIGYFNKNGSGFPMNEGVVLVTGDAMEAVGYNDFPAGWANGFPGWNGDADLEEAVGLPDGETNDATFIQFDFVPLIDEISFDFLFASEEYNQGSFECTFSDSFAFILTDLTTGVSTNLAVLPGTDTPIQVTNIHPDNGVCDAINEQYFGQYNDNNYDPINFNGQTAILTASSEVNTDHVYRIKLVIANEGDNSHNSAVFLLAGSFQIGDLDLGADLLVSSGNAVCAGGNATLNSQLSPADYEFEWYNGTTLIQNETGSTLTVTQPGAYTVKATYIGSTCSAQATVNVEFYPSVEDLTGNPGNLTSCNASGFDQFDLGSNTPVILGSLDPADYTITYHASQADAEGNIGAISSPYTNTTQFLQTIYVRIFNNDSQCVAIKTFNLIVQDLTPQFTVTPDFTFCDGTTGTITVTPGNFNPADVTFTWSDGTQTLPDTGSSITVSQGGAYTVVINNSGCTANATVNATVTPIPVADDPADVTQCGPYTLPALTTGNYYTGPNGTGTQLAVGTVITTTQPIYVYAASTTTPVCWSQNDFMVTINAAPAITNPGDQFPCTAFVLPALAAGQAYYTAPDGPAGTGTVIAAGTSISTDQTVYIYSESGTVPNCVLQDSFNVVITPVDVTAPAPVAECDSFELPALSAGNYYTGPGGTGTQLSAGDIINTTQPLYVYASNGTCSDEETFTVTITPSPVIASSQGCENGSYVLEVTFDDDVNYTADNTTIVWKDPSGMTIGNDATVAVTQTGIYTVTVTPNNGTCGIELPVDVDETGCMIQRGISPNGDGLNDSFDLSAFNVTKLSIFNRYGKEVYSYGNYTNQWHGQGDGGSELPTGTYFYMIERLNGESTTGWVYINREE
jgi:gliding motility-associated-like protein